MTYWWQSDLPHQVVQTLRVRILSDGILTIDSHDGHFLKIDMEVIRKTQWNNHLPDCYILFHLELTNRGFKDTKLDLWYVKPQPTLLLSLCCSLQNKLEQLVRLRSEIPPVTPWLPILVIHTRSQVKTRQNQSYKFKKIAKNGNFAINFTHGTPSEVAW